ncbi:MAG: glutamine-hydrolyzing carbamoyl-phosphate synthase small subunit [Kiritimatiellia bacterium]
MTDAVPASLMLEDGTVFRGTHFGWEGETAGEVVFNTAMTGYEEILTDPSYCGQMVVMCCPHIGNYGITLEDAESKKIWVQALIVRQASALASNHRAKETLSEYLRRNRIPGIEGIDTRALVRRIRSKGAMRGYISNGEMKLEELREKVNAVPDISSVNLVQRVSGAETSACKTFVPQKRPGAKKVAVIDFGTKLNILRCLERQDLEVAVFPSTSTLADLLVKGISGVVLSNGPGDPAAVTSGISLARELIRHNEKHYLPVMGICLGHQLLGLGAGAETFKLKFGHHGSNQPVRNLQTGRIEITSQNHNYSVNVPQISRDFEVTHVNLNDQTIEGMRHRKYPVFSVQYHPEAAPGPHDSHYLFSDFKELLNAQAE